eukprot:TRINITY_DN50193_c0_g1_i1.p1 TRINITY_DN50193_c0_g1~~TRINITY_DN50193_c0_g1_i1.p1  ORF type:complete len:136 (-),score=28.70 TRINITY_DN50193_c0_g1_i1:136-543(-)
MLCSLFLLIFLFLLFFSDSLVLFIFFFFQAEDGIRDAQESRGLGDVYKRQLFRKLMRRFLYAAIAHAAGPDKFSFMNYGVPVSRASCAVFPDEKMQLAMYTGLLRGKSLEGLRVLEVGSGPVSYTHLTLPTKRIV